MTTTFPPKKESNNKAAFKILSIEMLGIVALAIPILFVLNYFRIISLPFLPQKPLISEEKKREIKAYIEQPILFACPFEEKICTTGKQIFNTKSRKLSGIGYSMLSGGESIRAIFEGEYTVKTEQMQNVDITVLTLTDKDKQHEAEYRFIGKVAGDKDSGTVKQREVIGTIDGKKALLINFSALEYNFYVTIRNVLTNQELPLKPSTNGKGLGF